jgi:hypothetical protein
VEERHHRDTHVHAANEFCSLLQVVITIRRGNEIAGFFGLQRSGLNDSREKHDTREAHTIWFAGSTTQANSIRQPSGCIL